MFDLNCEAFTHSLQQALVNTIEQSITNVERVNSNIHQEAVNNAPVDIGTMRENSGYSVHFEGNKIISYVGFMEFYSVYVHQGTGIFALEGNGRQTPWWWKGDTEKWEGWHFTHGQKPKQFLWNAYLNALPVINSELAEGL